MAQWLVSLFQVLVIDLVLAGDNAIVVGLAAARLPAEQRRRVIVGGTIAAVVIRIALSLVAVNLLAIVGLTLAGGILLLWVAWKMWRELRGHRAAAVAVVAVATVPAAIWRVALADVSMSLDNVLAVAGAAHGHLGVLVVGLVVSVALMGIAASFVARLLQRVPWLSYLGLALVAYVALDMIWRGVHQVANAVPWAGL